MTKTECREQAHFAEHLARHGCEASAPDRAKIESAYASLNCEPTIAKRISAALDLI